MHLHAVRDGENKQHVQYDQRDKQGDQEEFAATASTDEMKNWTKPRALP
jgi:hypothetical protein